MVLSIPTIHSILCLSKTRVFYYIRWTSVERNDDNRIHLSSLAPTSIREDVVSCLLFILTYILFMSSRLHSVSLMGSDNPLIFWLFRNRCSSRHRFNLNSTSFQDFLYCSSQVQSCKQRGSVFENFLLRVWAFSADLDTGPVVRNIMFASLFVMRHINI